MLLLPGEILTSLETHHPSLGFDEDGALRSDDGDDVLLIRNNILILDSFVDQKCSLFDLSEWPLSITREPRKLIKGRQVCTKRHEV